MLVSGWHSDLGTGSVGSQRRAHGSAHALCKENPETDFRNKCGLNLGQEPGPANLRVALTSLQAMDVLAALAGEQGGVFEGWGLAGASPLGRAGLVVDFNSALKKICPSPLTPRSLSGNAASEISIGWHVGLVGLSGEMWRTELLGHLRQENKRWVPCVVSLHSPHSHGPHARRALGWLWGLQPRGTHGAGPCMTWAVLLFFP